jgi:hypothetical protein
MLLRQGMYRFDELRGVVLFSGNGAQEVKYQQPFVRAPNLILVRPDGAIYRYQVRDQGPEGFEVEITRTKGEDVLGYRATGAFRRTR